MLNTSRSAQKAAALTAKVASMTYEQRFERLEELSHTELTPETQLEFATLLFGAEATVGDKSSMDSGEDYGLG